MSQCVPLRGLRFKVGSKSKVSSFQWPNNFEFTFLYVNRIVMIDLRATRLWSHDRAHTHTIQLDAFSLRVRQRPDVQILTNVLAPHTSSLQDRAAVLDTRTSSSFSRPRIKLMKFKSYFLPSYNILCLLVSVVSFIHART